ncbi:MAG: glycosyltransferase family 4 protein [Flavobacteriales bacterium]|nr:glycosyltransferase family 4 protein [Flavobacteriales bacterium]
MKRKILFITNHRIGRSPGQRFRFEQYLGHLEKNGFDVHVSNIISKEDDAFLYKKGEYIKKALLAKRAWKKRKEDLKKANEYDIIFIFREALLTASTYFEKQFASSKAKIIFDFDDAIWLPNVSAGNKALQLLKRPSKTDEIIAHTDMVIAGNQYLADYALGFCNNVKVIPTTIDTSYHIRKNRKQFDKICIGWTGTQTTLKYLDVLKPVFHQLSEKFGDKIYFKIICDKAWEEEGLQLKNEAWNKEQEIQQLEEIDIGVMPLVDDQWSRGKCGFKGLQYMAMESAAILSPVGVNTEIIEHGKNGFLAETESDWLEQLSRLIENKELRLQIGKAGRLTVEQKFSVNAYKNLYVKYLNEIID